MPIDMKAEVLKRPFIDRTGEIPLTCVRPLNEAIEVSVIHSPNVNTFGPVLSAFTKACHRCSPPDPVAIAHGVAPLDEIASGTALWQAMETLRFTLLVRNCSRVFTHQLVRARVGITYSQQCFGDTDMRHADVLLPGGMDVAARSLMLDHSIKAKMHYADMLDNNIGLQQARYILPHTLATFIYIDASLNTLAGLYAKRCCTMTQAWETYLFAGRMRWAMIEAASYVEPAFKSPCATGSCYYHKAKDTPFAITHFYAPDATHDSFGWHPNSFVYGERTHENVASDGMNLLPKLYFEGERGIDSQQYGNLARRHDIHGRLDT